MRAGKVIKNVVLGAMALVAVAILIKGPRGDASIPKTTPDGRPIVVVDYWEKWTGNEGRQMRSIVDDFNRTVGREKAIYVRMVSISGIDQKTLVAVAAGVPPDVSGMWQKQLVQFAALDALMPLDELAAAHGITAATYKKVFWDACRYDGHLYAVVSTPETMALVYNKRAFHESAAKLRAAGLDADRPPRSLQELDRYAAALDEKDSAGRLVRAGTLPAASWYLQQMPYWFGGDVWDATTHRFTLTSPPAVAAYKWAQSYSKRLGAAAVTDFKSGMGSFDSPQSPFLAGTELMQLQGPWMANFVLNHNPAMAGVANEKDYDLSLPAATRKAMAQWAAAPFPSAVPGLDDVCFADYDDFVIPRGAKHPAEAFEFIAYVTSQPVMEKLCGLHSKPSPLAKVSADFLQHHKNPYVDVFDALARSPNARFLAPCPTWPQASADLDAVLQRLVLHPDLPAEVELANLQDKLQHDYDVFAERQRIRHGTAN